MFMMTTAEVLNKAMYYLDFILTGFVLFPIIGIHGMTRTERDQPVRAQLRFDNSGALFTCGFPTILECTLTTRGLIPELPKQLHYRLIKKPQGTSNHLDRLLRHLPVEQDKRSSQDQRYARYESISGDLHMVTTCAEKSNHNKTFSLVGIMTYHTDDFIVRPERFGSPLLSSFPLEVTIHKFKESKHLHEKSNMSIKKHVRLLESPTRHRREIIKLVNYTIRLLVVVDYSVLSRWRPTSYGNSEQNWSEHTRQTKTEIDNYYNHVVNGIDSRYKNIAFPDFTLRIKLVDVTIMDKQLLHLDHFKGNKVNADSALKVFRNWTNETEGLPSYDHAILFVGYDLYTNTSDGNSSISHTSGLAYIGTMCQPENSVSIVEEQGGFQSIGTAAHELGHSLGALHDGEGNDCLSENRYIMAASGFGPVPQDKLHHPWKFSTCSVDYFRRFLALQLAQGSSCLVDNGTAHAPTITHQVNIKGIPNEHHQDSNMPGQYYSPDEQCRLIWGQKSYQCRGSEFGDPSAICTSMYCRDTDSANDCVLHTAARGTSCGDKKWCIDGVCRHANKAPSKPADCVLGDQPGKAFNGMTCEELVGFKPSYCYQEKVWARCCQSCKTISRPVTGCEFGDRIKGCQSWHCNHSEQYREISMDCCETCKTGEDLAGDISLSTETSVELHTDDISTPASKNIGHINGITCMQYIHTYGGYICYSERVRSDTCQDDCAVIRSKRQGCEYGDRTPFLCAEMANLTTLTCSTHGSWCCKSCLTDTAALVSGQPVLYLDSVLLLLLMFVVGTVMR